MGENAGGDKIFCVNSSVLTTTDDVNEPDGNYSYQLTNDGYAKTNDHCDYGVGKYVPGRRDIFLPTNKTRKMCKIKGREMYHHVRSGSTGDSVRLIVLHSSNPGVPGRLGLSAGWKNEMFSRRATYSLSA